MSDVLPSGFFGRSVLHVAPEMLGKVLVRKVGEKYISAIITDVEAYDGIEDKACHASKGLTPRTTVMFGPAGYWYVYLCYGMYWMLNVVTGAQGYPAAILIRGVAYISGPGRLTRAFSIDKNLNGKPADPDSGLWVEDRGIVVPKNLVKRTPRIGVKYAGEWAEKPYRFVLTSPALALDHQ